MKRPARPFVVEFKKKRGSTPRQHSIWGDLDLSAVAAESLKEPVQLGQSNTDASDPVACEALDQRNTGNAGEVAAFQTTEVLDDVGGSEVSTTTRRCQAKR